MYPVAHVRDGTDPGCTWHDSNMLKKMNTFNGYVACADHMVKAKYCARSRLLIEGESAGELLVAAPLNRRPDLCIAVVLMCRP